MEVHQVVVSASLGDAITNASIDLQDELRRHGRSELFARYLDPRLADRVRPLDQYDQISSRGGADLIVYHVAIGEPAVFSFLRQRPERLAVIYHNISPSEHWLPYDARF